MGKLGYLLIFVTCTWLVVQDMSLNRKGVLSQLYSKMTGG